MQPRLLIFLGVLGVVFSLFSAGGSRAEIIVHEVGVTVPENSPSPYQRLFVDIAENETAIDDYQEDDIPPVGANFLILAENESVGNSYLNSEPSFGLRDEVGFMTTDAEGSYFVERLQVGDTVDGPLDDFLENVVLTGDWLPEYIAWSHGQSGYIGMRMTLDLDENPATQTPHYGWLYIHIEDDASVTLIEYAYETTAGQSIPVPEPQLVEACLLGVTVLGALVPLPIRRFAMNPTSTPVLRKNLARKH